MLWEQEGLDMQMMLYDCVSTGNERGLLQVVPNAFTLGSILLEATDKKKKAAGRAVTSVYLPQAKLCYEGARRFHCDSQMDQGARLACCRWGERC